MPLRSDELVNELEAIRLESPSQLLKPEAVVASAASAASRLHNCFEWDDTKAAHKHRLAQARKLIRVACETLPGSNKEYNVFVSLTCDRERDEDDEGVGGYRSMHDVMRSEDLRRYLLADARRELRTYQNKYSTLEEVLALAATPQFQAILNGEDPDPPTGRRHGSRRSKKKAGKKAKKKAGKKKKAKGKKKAKKKASARR